MDKLNPGASLKLGESLTSRNGKYELTLQPDGNLVLYDSRNPIWATNTQQQDVDRVEMQTDGDLVIYTRKNRPVWSSRTDGHAGSSLILQDDRNLVLAPASGNPLWTSETPVKPPAASGKAGAPTSPSAGPSVAPASASGTPTASTKRARTYKVARGDSLWRIAEKFYGSGPEYRKIAQANGITNPDLINPGQDLVIPE